MLLSTSVFIRDITTTDPIPNGLPHGGIDTSLRSCEVMSKTSMFSLLVNSPSLSAVERADCQTWIFASYPSGLLCFKGRKSAYNAGKRAFEAFGRVSNTSLNVIQCRCCCTPITHAPNMRWLAFVDPRSMIGELKVKPLSLYRIFKKKIDLIYLFRVG